MEPLEFHRSEPFTLGVELEFQLLDRTSLDLVAKAPALLASPPPCLRQHLKPEFIQSMIEVNTRICHSVAEVETHLRELCQQTEELALTHDCLLYAASLHPFAESAEQLLTPHKRYSRIMAELQMVGRRFITQGLHVHVGIPDGDTAIRICDSMRIHLPILLALSTSSPFYEGEDTGLYSYRAKLFEALPLAGMPDYFENWFNFRQIASALIRSRIIRQGRDLWWDVRPHPYFGTVEIRICDLPSRFTEIIALVALIQALVKKLSQARTPAMDANMQILRSNKWQAARYGLAGRFVDPLRLNKQTQAQAAATLMASLEPTLTELGTASYLAPLDQVLAQGTSAHRQRELYADTHDFTAMIREIRAEFWQ